ncbi:MAG TPA: hypothetical protein VND20_05525, partial [Candidatus Binataceae bacterium]|nr:hypothetical protein [Candidatus Binataceae bacterium]
MKVAYGANGKDGSDGLIGRELSKLLPRSRKQKLWKSQPFQYRHHIYYDVDMPSEPIKLKIVLNGEAPGIAEHRLSIGGLALPLAHLLKATRRIASDIVRDGGQYASRRGPYAREARAIDLQIETLGQGCVEVNLVASIDEAQGFQTGLFPQDMLLRTMSNLLDAIKAESTG